MPFIIASCAFVLVAVGPFLDSRSVTWRASYLPRQRQARCHAQDAESTSIPASSAVLRFGICRLSAWALRQFGMKSDHSAPPESDSHHEVLSGCSQSRGRRSSRTPFGERPDLKLMNGTVIRAADRWSGSRSADGFPSDHPARSGLAPARTRTRTGDEKRVLQEDPIPSL